MPAWVRIYIDTEAPSHNSIPLWRNSGSRWLSFLTVAEFAALLHQLGDNARPSGLMTGPHAETGVAVEVLVKKNQVAPMRIRLELLQVAESRSVALLVTKKNVCHPVR